MMRPECSGVSMGLAPKVQFVQRGDAHLAYQVFGDGPPDVLDINGYASHLEQSWQWPLLVRTNEAFARLGRIAEYDWRGYGMSDPLPAGGYSVEDLAADALAVLDAAGFERVVVWGDGPGGAVAIWLAVHRPERVDRLVLNDASACRRPQPGYDLGLTDTEIAERRAMMGALWGTGATISFLGASLEHDERLREEWARFERVAATPSTFMAAFDVSLALDVRELLPQVAVPTLVLHSVTDTLIPASHGIYLAEHIPGARYIEVKGDLVHELTSGEIGGEVSEFMTGSRERAHVERSLQVILFTDIAGSTRQAAGLGDKAWTALLAEFRGLVRNVLHRFGAREVNTRGDDFFAVVANPSAAIEIAREIRSESAPLGLEVRSGLHLGEVDEHGDDYAGLAVHIGARIGALAEPGEILVSQTVRDALLGSRHELASRGVHQLKGVPDEWRMYAVAN
jgi:pimeloyl-ACP methyl ester carboxylesterase/class 3 adenylate cyclase